MSTVSPVDQDNFSRGGRPKMVGLFLCLLTSERGPFLVPSAVEGAREGAAGANKESGGRFAH